MDELYEDITKFNSLALEQLRKKKEFYERELNNLEVNKLEFTQKLGIVYESQINEYKQKLSEVNESINNIINENNNKITWG